jgi:ABC-2 type transport system permease protein
MPGTDIFHKIKYSRTSRTVLLIVFLVLVNFLSTGYFFRIDLTSEKRYTLSDETKNLLKNLNDVVFIRIYLDGELNIPLKHFQKNIIETLDEFKVFAGNKFEYELIDPFEGVNEKTRQKILGELSEKGLSPVNIRHSGKDGSVTEKIVIPGAMIIYHGTEIPVTLLLNNPGKSGEENLNNSIESLEYTFISNIKNLTSETTSKIAFIEGHGEWPDPFVGDMMKELSKSYQIDRGRLNGQPGILDNYEAIVIAGPVREFSEADKYIIDQYIMNGGKVLWLVDAVNVDFDSLANGYSLAIPNNLNIEDMFFRYGVRINYNLIEDAQCTYIPVNVALAGSPPNFQPAPWTYYPVISPPSNNPITQNLNMVLCRFASSIDAIEARKDIKKTPLLVSSPQVITREVPAIVRLDEINTPPSANDFNLPPQVIGILLEGKFESVFKNRSVINYFDKIPANKKDEGVETRQIIISDADIIRNDVKQTPSGPSISPLGFDRYSNQTFGNKDFLANALSYLTDNKNLLELRGREFKIRLLNRTKLNSERLKWQLMNVGLPVLFILLTALIFSTIRKAKYSK